MSAESMNLQKCVNDIRTNRVLAIHAIWLLLFALLILIDSASGQEINLNFRNLTDEDGLFNNTVLAIYKDDRGFMWFATEGGLHRFDGINFTVYRHDPSDPHSISHNEISKIFQDSSGTLWFVTVEALDTYDYETNTFTHYHLVDRDFTEPVSNIVEDRNGNLLVCQFPEIYRVNRKTREIEPIEIRSHLSELADKPTDLEEIEFLMMSADSSGLIWMATEPFGIISFDPDSGSVKVHAPHENVEELDDLLYVDQEKRVWLAGERGLGILDKQTGRFIPKLTRRDLRLEADMNFIFRSVYEDANNNLWFGTECGLLLYQKSSDSFFRFFKDGTNPYGLVNNYVGSVFVSNEGMLWVGHDEGGVSYARISNLFSFLCYKKDPTKRITLSSNRTTSLFESASGDVWIGTWSGLNLLDFENHSYQQYLHGKEISCVYEDSKGDLWVGVLGEGVYRRKSESEGFQHYRYMDEVKKTVNSEIVYCIFEDEQGRVWFAGDALEYFNKESEQFINWFPGEVGDYFDAEGKINRDYYDWSVFSVAKDGNGNVWLASDNGLINMGREPGQNLPIEYRSCNSSAHGLKHNHIWDIIFDHNGDMWLGTTGGLYHGTHDDTDDSWQFRFYGMEDGLPDDIAFQLLQDDHGNIWIGTNNGLSKFDPKSRRFSNFDIYDGLPSKAVGSYTDNIIALNSAIQLRNGDFMFNGPRGVARIRPDKITANNHIPPVYIRDFQIFNRSVPIGEMAGIGTILRKAIWDTTKITLSHRENVFSFDFIAVDYADPYRNRYAHKMEGFDKDWIYTDAKNRFVTYTNLPGGDYTFKVKASNGEGVWNEEGASIRVSITPPFWETWWFRTSSVLAIFVCVLGGVQFRTRSIRRQNEDLAKTNAQLQEQIVARVQAEEEKERLESQLRQAQKMEAVGQLAGGVAHDFNNMLQAILGNVEIAKSKQRNGSLNLDELQSIQLAGERAASLTRQMLAFSRRQILRPENLNLNDLISDLLVMVRRIIGEHIILKFIPQKDLGVIHADAGQLEQVLMNLCVNARDAMLDGGRLVIETHNEIIDQEYCKSHAYAKKGAYVMFSITDTGAGIPPEVQDQIFEPFFTTKEVGKGTGLGLSTVYGTVKQHNGMISVYSELGMGTMFKIYFPMVDESAKSVVHETEDTAEGGSETILLAEDDEMVCRMVLKTLKHAGYSVLVAKNGVEALNTYKKHANEISLVLLDVVMPEMGGRQVFEEIKAINPDARILFNSGYSSNAIHTGFVLEKGLMLLQKPFGTNELLKKIRTLIDS